MEKRQQIWLIVSLITIMIIFLVVVLTFKVSADVETQDENNMTVGLCEEAGGTVLDANNTESLCLTDYTSQGFISESQASEGELVSESSYFNEASMNTLCETVGYGSSGSCQLDGNYQQLSEIVPSNTLEIIKKCAQYVQITPSNRQIIFKCSI